MVGCRAVRDLDLLGYLQRLQSVSPRLRTCDLTHARCLVTFGSEAGIFALHNEIIDLEQTIDGLEHDNMNERAELSRSLREQEQELPSKAEAKLQQSLAEQEAKHRQILEESLASLEDQSYKKLQAAEAEIQGLRNDVKLSMGYRKSAERAEKKLKEVSAQLHIMQEACRKNSSSAPGASHAEGVELSMAKNAIPRDCKEMRSQRDELGSEARRARVNSPSQHTGIDIPGANPPCRLLSSREGAATVISHIDEAFGLGGSVYLSRNPAQLCQPAQNGQINTCQNAQVTVRNAERGMSTSQPGNAASGGDTPGSSGGCISLQGPCLAINPKSAAGTQRRANSGGGCGGGGGGHQLAGDSQGLANDGGGIVQLQVFPAAGSQRRGDSGRGGRNSAADSQGIANDGEAAHGADPQAFSCVPETLQQAGAGGLACTFAPETLQQAGAGTLACSFVPETLYPYDDIPSFFDAFHSSAPDDDGIDASAPPPFALQAAAPRPCSPNTVQPPSGAPTPSPPQSQIPGDNRSRPEQPGAMSPNTKRLQQSPCVIDITTPGGDTSVIDITSPCGEVTTDRSGRTAMARILIQPSDGLNLEGALAATLPVPGSNSEGRAAAGGIVGGRHAAGGNVGGRQAVVGTADQRPSIGRHVEEPSVSGRHIAAQPVVAGHVEGRAADAGDAGAGERGQSEGASQGGGSSARVGSSGDQHEARGRVRHHVSPAGKAVPEGAGEHSPRLANSLPCSNTGATVGAGRRQGAVSPPKDDGAGQAGAGAALHGAVASGRIIGGQASIPDYYPAVSKQEWEQGQHRGAPGVGGVPSSRGNTGGATKHGHPPTGTAGWDATTSACSPATVKHRRGATARSAAEEAGDNFVALSRQGPVIAATPAALFGETDQPSQDTLPPTPTHDTAILLSSSLPGSIHQGRGCNPEASPSTPFPTQDTLPPTPGSIHSLGHGQPGAAPPHAIPCLDNQYQPPKNQTPFPTQDTLPPTPSSILSLGHGQPGAAPPHAIPCPDNQYQHPKKRGPASSPTMHDHPIRNMALGSAAKADTHRAYPAPTANHAAKRSRVNGPAGVKRWDSQEFPSPPQRGPRMKYNENQAPEFQLQAGRESNGTGGGRGAAMAGQRAGGGQTDVAAGGESNGTEGGRGAAETGLRPGGGQQHVAAGSGEAVGHHPGDPLDVVGKPEAPRSGAGDRGNAKAAFKYKEVVRKKDEREALQGFDCPQCKQFYDALASWGQEVTRPVTCEHDPRGGGAGAARVAEGGRGVGLDRGGGGGLQPPRVANASNVMPPPVNGAGLAHQYRQEVSKHRYRNSPPSTPAGFWDMGFNDSLDSRF
eukprot:gene19481-26142_t